MRGQNGIPCGFAIDAVYRNGRDGVVVGREIVQIVLQEGHACVLVAKREGGGELTVNLVVPQPLCVQTVETLDGVVNALNGVPGRIAYNAVGGQVEDLLKRPHGGFSLKPINAVGVRDFRNAGVVVGDAVEPNLKNPHIPTGTVQRKGRRRGRGRATSHRCIANDVYVLAVVVL